MEPEGLLLCSQELTAMCYPSQVNPFHIHTLLHKCFIFLNCEIVSLYYKCILITFFFFKQVNHMSIFISCNEKALTG
jgi:hypothetical protein